jgi:hypothetical protein
MRTRSSGCDERMTGNRTPSEADRRGGKTHRRLGASTRAALAEFDHALETAVTDGLAGRQRQAGRRRKSRRKTGGHVGHPGHDRSLGRPIVSIRSCPSFRTRVVHCQHPLAHFRGWSGRDRGCYASWALSRDGLYLLTPIHCASEERRRVDPGWRGSLIHRRLSFSFTTRRGF